MISIETSVNDVTFVAFDVETTGLNYSVDNIIEIGAVKSNTKQEIASYQSFIKIDKSIPPEASKINSITDQMLADAPPITHVLKKFLTFIEGCVIVAHNLSFDFKFINAELTRNNMPAITNVLQVDTLSLTRKIFPKQQSNKLSDLATQFNLGKVQFHRALDDAKICKNLLMTCINQISILGELALKEIVL